MGWKIDLQHTKSKLKYLTFVNSYDELGNFLLNIDKDNYIIISIVPTFHDELKDSRDFIKKDKNIEFGKGGNK